MRLQNILNGIGLSEKESKIYLTLLTLKEALPGIIARRSGIKRPTTYVILEQLVSKGLASHITRKGTTAYRPLDPRGLLEIQENKLTHLKHALPDLLQLHTSFIATPQMSVFEGTEGLIQIMEDTLTTSNKELLCWADVTEAVTTLREYYPTYIAKKVKRGIWVRGVVCADKMAQRFKDKGKEELRELYLVPKKDFPFRNEINIYDDKVAIISHEDKIGVIIQNKNIADTQKAIFRLGFAYAKILDKA